MGTMQTRIATTCSTALLLGMLSAMPAAADPFTFSTGNPDGLMATASPPGHRRKFEIELADDFALTDSTSITSATFTGLVTGGCAQQHIGEVVVEIYRVFPADFGRQPDQRTAYFLDAPGTDAREFAV